MCFWPLTLPVAARLAPPDQRCCECPDIRSPQAETFCASARATSLMPVVVYRAEVSPACSYVPYLHLPEFLPRAARSRRPGPAAGPACRVKEAVVRHHPGRSAVTLAFLTTAATVLAVGASAVPGSALTRQAAAYSRRRDTGRRGTADAS